MLTSVRARVVLPIVAVLALFLVVLSYGLYQQLARGLYAEQDQVLTSQTEYIAFIVQSYQHPESLMKWLPRFLENPNLPIDETLIRILSPTGDILFQSGPRAYYPVRGFTSFSDAMHNHASAFQNVEAANGTELRLISTPVKVGERITNVVQFAIPTANVKANVTRIRNGIILSCIVIIIGATIGGWFITGQALKPVRAMTDSAKTIGEGNVEERLPVPDSNDELAELAQAFNEMIERLDSSSKQMQRFTADASHELRTPLTIMKGEIEVALRKTRTPEEWQRIAVSFLDEVNHMSAITDDLLSLARIDSGEMTIAREVIDFDEVITHEAERFRKMAEANHCLITCDSIPGLFVVGDREMLERLVRNLLENAIKYSVHGGDIRVTADLIGQEIVVSVHDSGMGITREDLPRIFERFYRGQNSLTTHRRGTGLGLSICLWITQAHGGQLEVASQVGAGSTFTVRFPANDDIENPTPA